MQVFERIARMLRADAHGMKDLASKGPVFLKLSGRNIRVGEIRLMRSAREE